MPAVPVKVLYIAGWGRSGTTILDNVLGSCESVFSAGELFYLWRRGLVGGRRCGCGNPVRDCSLWRAVIDKAFDGRPPPPKEAAARQRQVVRVRDTLRLTRAELSAEAARYRDDMARIYRAISAVTGAKLVVDSSKLPPAAAVLGRIDGIESYLLHMVRDPRAVAHSWMRTKMLPDVKVPRQMDKHSAVQSARNWVAWNTLIEHVARKEFGQRAMRVRYEDFVADPQAWVNEILGFTGTDSGGGPFEDEKTVRLGANHTVSGNPSRFHNGPVILRPDDAWRTEQAVRPRLVTTAIALPLLQRYGYRVLA